MKPVTVILFTIASITISMLIGENYKALNISKKLWIVITAIATIVFVAKYIMDIMIHKEEQ